MKVFEDVKSLELQITFFYDKLVIAWRQAALRHMGERPEEFSAKMLRDFEEMGGAWIEGLAYDVRRLNGDEKYDYELELVSMVMNGIFLALERSDLKLNFGQICAVHAVMASMARHQGDAFLRARWNSYYNDCLVFMDKYFMTEPEGKDMKVLVMLPSLIMAGFRGLVRGMAREMPEDGKAVWN